MADAHQIVVTYRETSPMFCLPAIGVPTAHLLDAVIEHAKNHPRSLDHSAREEIVSAFSRKWPCKLTQR
jgi:hypothetical protein